RTLDKVWDADLCLGALADNSPRIADLAMIEQRVHAALPAGVLTTRNLRDAALSRVGHAKGVLGPVELAGVTRVAPVWRPLLDALAEVLELRWRASTPADRTWFRGKLVDEAAAVTSPVELVSCANPQAEVVEALR